MLFKKHRYSSNQNITGNQSQINNVQDYSDTPYDEYITKLSVKNL